MLFSGEFDSREYTDDRPAGHYYRMKVGEFRGMDLGINTGAWFEPTWEWAQKVFPDEFSASCGDDTPKTATAVCGEFLLGIAPEFAATDKP